MLLSIPTGIDLRGPSEKRANLSNVLRRMSAFKFMRRAGFNVLAES
jgi:hypothetical protein